MPPSPRLKAWPEGEFVTLTERGCLVQARVAEVLYFKADRSTSSFAPRPNRA